MLIASRFDETYIIHFDDSGTPFHFDYSVDGDYCKSIGLHDNIQDHFASQVIILQSQKTVNLPIMMEQSIDSEKEVKVNQGFLLTYWYIFVPLLIVMLIGGQTPEENKK